MEKNGLNDDSVKKTQKKNPKMKRKKSNNSRPVSRTKSIVTEILEFEEIEKCSDQEAAGRVYLAKEFADNTTFHGLNQIFKSDHWSRKFWFVVLFAVVMIVTWQITALLVHFMSNPTSTNLKIIQPKDGLEIPSLTICTLQKFNKTKLQLLYPNISKVLTEFSSTSFFSAYSTALMDLNYFTNKNVSLDELQQSLNYTLGTNNVVDFVEKIAFNCHDQFLQCWFENGEIFDCCNLNMSIHFKKFLIHSGPCFEIVVDNLSQRLPGPVGGFGFVYWYPLDDLFPTAYNTYDENGLHIYTSPTEAMLEKNPVVLPVGTHARISLQAMKTIRLIKDQLGRNTCNEKKLKYFANYSYPACQVECLMEKLLQECNCIGINTYGHLPKHHICTPIEAYNCFQRLAFQFSSLLAKCRLSNCSEACTYWTYRVSLTSGKVFNRVNQKEMMDHWRLPKKGDPKLSLIIADVYFSDIEYLEVKEITTMTFVSFVSNLGGAMGLWTGASIVTWIHLIYFCLKVTCCKKHNGDKTVQTYCTKDVQRTAHDENKKAFSG